MTGSRHRWLSEGETAMLRSVYGDAIPYDRVRVHARRWFWPLSNKRAMAPNGHVYWPGADYADDFAAPDVPLSLRAVFVHEGAHLFQWYALGWTVWLRGPFDRNYDYRLVPGRRFAEYGLEQMGMIAQHHFTLARGGRIGLPYAAADYAALLPVR